MNFWIKLRCCLAHTRNYRTQFSFFSSFFIKRTQFFFLFFHIYELFRFEKYISGKYLGELVRIILEELHSKKLVLTNTPKADFPNAWTFDTSEVSTIEE